MLAGIDVVKADPVAVAAGLLDGLEADLDDIAPEVMSRDGLALWRSNPKGLEAQLAQAPSLVIRSQASEETDEGLAR